jgi:arsenate reductase
MEATKQMIYPKIEQTIQSLNINSIPAERKELLQGLIDYLKTKVDNKEPINLNFICTHNSRRSHLSQIWAQVIASYLNIKNVTCYSGGTEATAMFPMVGETLSKQGFEILKLSETENPVYAVKFSDTIHPVICFSKTYDATFNPNSGFGAIMTCDSANEACPMVNGAEKRFPITYEDPKAFDETPLQAEKYHERSIQIASELLYVFETAKKLN